MNNIILTNKDNINPTHKSEHKIYEYYKHEVTKRSDNSNCYVAIYEIPPQKSNYPYHYHANSTECFYIISGHGILETPDGEKEIVTGDVIVCPPLEQGAHRIINTSQDEPLTYFECDTMNICDVVSYPKTDKTGVIIHNKSFTVFKNNTKVNYYDGE